MRSQLQALRACATPQLLPARHTSHPSAVEPCSDPHSPCLRLPPSPALRVPPQAQECMLFAGTAVSNGAGLGVVTSIGMSTEIGKILALIQVCVGGWVWGGGPVVVVGFLGEG